MATNKDLVQYIADQMARAKSSRRGRGGSKRNARLQPKNVPQKE